MKKKLLWGLAILAGIIGLYAAVMLLQRFTAKEPAARPPVKVAAPHKAPAARPRPSLASFAKTKAAKRPVIPAKAGLYKLTHAVTLNGAAEGALSNTAQGLKDLQDYLDAAGGNEKLLKARADALLKALAAGPAAKNFSTLAPATEQLLAAFRRSGTAAYQLPLYVGDGIGLGKDQKGWDFGPGAKKPYIGFIRVGITDPNLTGHNLKALETSPKSLLLSDGNLEVSGYGAELKAGTYQVYIVAGNLPEPTPAPMPFGSGVRSNGTEIDLVDMSDDKFGGYGLLTNAGPEIIGLQDKPESATRIKTIKNLGAEGKLLVTRAFVEGSTLKVELDDPAVGATYISGIIIAPSDLDRLDKQLQDDIGALLAGLEPGYGTLPPRSRGFFFQSPAPVGSALSQLPGIISHYATEFGSLLGGRSSGCSASSGSSSGCSISSSTSSTSGGTTTSSTSGGTTTSSTSGGSGGSTGGSSSSGSATSSSTSGGTTTSSTSGGTTTSSSSGGTTSSSTSGGTTTSSSSGGTTTSSTSGGTTTSSTSGGTTTSSTSGGTTTSSTSGGTTTSSTSGGATTSSTSGGSGGSSGGSSSSGSASSSSTSGGTTTSSTSGGTTTSSTSGGTTTSSSSGGTTTSSTSGGTTTSSTSGGTTTSSTSGGLTTSSSSGGTTTSSTSGGTTTSSSSGGTTTSSTSGGTTTSSTSGGTTTSSTSGGTTTSSTSGGTTTSSTSGGTTSTSSGGPDGQNLVANAGTDKSGPLGASFNLDLCPSTFNNASLCSFTEPYLQQNFTMEWLLNTTSLGFSHGATPFQLDTDLFGALFSNPGDYLISLKLTYLGGVAPLESGDSLKLTLFSPPPIIAEPAAGLIFLAGLGGLGLAVRRRKALK